MNKKADINSFTTRFIFDRFIKLEINKRFLSDDSSFTMLYFLILLGKKFGFLQKKNLQLIGRVYFIAKDRILFYIDGGFGRNFRLRNDLLNLKKSLFHFLFWCLYLRLGICYVSRMKRASICSQCSELSVIPRCR